MRLKIVNRVRLCMWLAFLSGGGGCCAIAPMVGLVYVNISMLFRVIGGKTVCPAMPGVRCAACIYSSAIQVCSFLPVVG